MPRPQCSHLASELKGTGKKPLTSALKTKEVVIEGQNGSKLTGFFKPCNPESYSPIHAKMVVAGSVRMRMALGDDFASDDRLVFDDKGEITGTVSIENPNFIPLLCFLFPKKFNDPRYHKAVPDTPLLLAHVVKVVKMLIGLWRYKNNDGHPDNLSLEGIIDLDECFFPITSIFKYGELKQIPLLLSELEAFPIINSRSHWPTRKLPSTKNIFKIYKTSAFKDLKGNPEFVKECCRRILIELLAYDETLLEKRLKLYLNDLPLDLRSLAPKKRNLLLEYDNSLCEKRILNDLGEKEFIAIKASSPEGFKTNLHEHKKLHSLLFDTNNKEHNFVEFSLRYFAEEELEFREVAFKYSKFRTYLLHLNKDFKDFNDIKLEFKRLNEKNTNPHSYKQIDRSFLFIWRDLFRETLKSEVTKLEQIITIEEKAKLCSVSPASSISDWDASDSTVLIKKSGFTKLKAHADKLDFKMHAKALRALKLLDELIKSHYGRSDLGLKDNIQFVEDIQKILEELNEEFSSYKQKLQHLKTLLKNYEIKKSKKLFSEIASLKNTIKAMDVLCSGVQHFSDSLAILLSQMQLNSIRRTPNTPLFLIDAKSTPKSFSEPRKIETPKPILIPPLQEEPSSADPVTPASSALNPDDATYDDCKREQRESQFATNQDLIIKTLGVRLKAWLTRCSPDEIKKIIKESYHVYKSRAWWRTHNETCFNLTLSEILTEGGYDTTSLNTLIVKNACLKMLEQQKDKDLEVCIDRNNMQWWSEIALNIATHANLINKKNDQWTLLSWGRK